MTVLRIGTRGSELALVQANGVAALLQERAGVACEIVVIRTSGDRLAEAPLADIGGKRVFVKEIEDALLARTVDIAVHSSKDLPALLPEGLALGAVLPREDPRDVLVLPNGEPAAHGVEGAIRHLGEAPTIGTSSVRRTAQLRRLWPGAAFAPVRGNLGTRLRKLDAGEFGALVLAAAGLRRLGRADRISAPLSTDQCVPAPGQGIVAVEIRGDDDRVRRLVEHVDDEVAGAALTAERAVVARLGGGCQMPLGAYAAVHAGHLSLSAIVAAVDGARAARAQASGPMADAAAIGARAADALLLEGASDILAAIERTRASVEGLQP